MDTLRLVEGKSGISKNGAVLWLRFSFASGKLGIYHTKDVRFFMKITKIETVAPKVKRLKVAAYCRVSTDNDEQLESLEVQMMNKLVFSENVILEPYVQKLRNGSSDDVVLKISGLYTNAELQLYRKISVCQT